MIGSTPFAIPSSMRVFGLGIAVMTISAQLFESHLARILVPF
jgi:hypothetical protein